MDQLKQLISLKRKQVENFVIENNGSKIIKTVDIIKKQNEELLKEQGSNNYNKIKPTKESISGRLESELSSPTKNCLTRAEVIQRLRSRAQPIRLFGETDNDAFKRLRKLELEQPELKEGWQNDFQTAMSEVDNDLVDEVIKGTKGEVGKHDVVMPEAEDATWDQIMQRALLLGEGEDPNRDCDIIYEFIVYLLKRWGRELNARDEATKRSDIGKLDAGFHKQSMDYLRPLMESLRKHTCNFDIRIHLIQICRLIIIDRDYIKANTAYMEMAVGNAPWPVGVTRSGIHQRPGSAKAYVSNVAHVLNDEKQRKYIHGLKRLMSKCQSYYPADPSKCVEYVRKE